MIVSTRPASGDDVDVLVALYRDLEQEQAALRKMWPVADGLDEPIAESFRGVLDDPESLLYVGLIDDVPLGFVWGRIEPLLAQAEGRLVGVIRLIFTELAARGVGVGDAMVNAVMDQMRSRGISLFDARVSPGHRNAKNFFEAHGFAARLIVMHHEDADETV